MGKIKHPQKAKLILGMITQKQEYLNIAEEKMKNIFGKMDFESKILPFIHTDYYEKEFGKNLVRKFISFENLISIENSAEYKIITNKIEQEMSENNLRKINLDPGYLNLSKLVLLSTKDYSHRIYLKDGIYAEVTLFYKDKTFQPFSYAYMDYRTKEYIDIFNKIREIYRSQLCMGGCGGVQWVDKL